MEAFDCVFVLICNSPSTLVHKILAKKTTSTWLSLGDTFRLNWIGLDWTLINDMCAHVPTTITFDDLPSCHEPYFTLSATVLKKMAT